MNTLVIACSKSDYGKLKKQKLLNGIKSSFKADNICWCDSVNCLKDLAGRVDSILYMNSFEVPYYKVDAIAKSSLSVDKIIGAILEKDKLWIYDSGTVANCIDPDGVAFLDAIKRVLDVSTWVPKLCNIALAFIVCATITMAILLSLSKHKGPVVYAEQPNQTQEEQPDIRYSITGLIIDK